MEIRIIMCQENIFAVVDLLYVDRWTYIVSGACATEQCDGRAVSVSQWVKQQRVPVTGTRVGRATRIALSSVLSDGVVALTMS